MRIEEIEYEADGRQLIGTFTVDEYQRGARPAVLLCHEGPGLDEHVKGRAVRLASLGYAAFALDYNGGGQQLPLEETMPRIVELRDGPRPGSGTGPGRARRPPPARGGQTRTGWRPWASASAADGARAGSQRRRRQGRHRVPPGPRRRRRRCRPVDHRQRADVLRGGRPPDRQGRPGRLRGRDDRGRRGRLAPRGARRRRATASRTCGWTRSGCPAWPTTSPPTAGAGAPPSPCSRRRSARPPPDRPRCLVDQATSRARNRAALPRRSAPATATRNAAAPAGLRPIDIRGLPRHEHDDVAEQQPPPPAGDRAAEDVLDHDDVAEAHPEGGRRVATDGGQ